MEAIKLLIEKYNIYLKFHQDHKAAKKMQLANAELDLSELNINDYDKDHETKRYDLTIIIKSSRYAIYLAEGKINAFEIMLFDLTELLAVESLKK
jgi:hypothetical protein